MMQIAQQEFMPEAQQRERRRAVSSRLWPQRRVNVAARPKPPVLIAAAPDAPLWQRETVHFKHHVLMFKAERSPYEYLLLRCIETGVSYEDLLAVSRYHAMARLRWKFSYELKLKFNLGNTAIGRLLDLDPSSIFHGITRHCEMNGIEISVPVTFAISPYVMRQAKKLYGRGLSIPKIAKELSLSQTTLRARARDEGWYIDPKEVAYADFVETVDHDELMAMVDIGLKTNTIMKKLKKPMSAIVRYLKEHGVQTIDQRGQG